MDSFKYHHYFKEYSLLPFLWLNYLCVMVWFENPNLDVFFFNFVFDMVILDTINIYSTLWNHIPEKGSSCLCLTFRKT